jgi:signal transduction histidine kinase
MGDAIAGKKAARLHGTRCELRGSRRVESARLAGHEEERARIVRMFHDEVSSTMLAVLFAIESAKDELKAQNLPQAETVAKASELLQEVGEKISEVLEDKKGR